jgi:archaellum component FlaC
MDDVRAWLLGLFSIVVAFVSLAYSINRNGKEDRRKELEEVYERVTALENAFRTEFEAGIKQRADIRERVVQIEERLRNMPDRDMVYKIMLDVAEVRSDTKVQNQVLLSVTNRLEKLLLIDGKKP